MNITIEKYASRPELMRNLRQNMAEYPEDYPHGVHIFHSEALARAKREERPLDRIFWYSTSVFEGRKYYILHELITP